MEPLKGSTVIFRSYNYISKPNLVLCLPPRFMNHLQTPLLVASSVLNIQASNEQLRLDCVPSIFSQYRIQLPPTLRIIAKHDTL